ILFRNGKDAQALDGFEWVASFCMHRANSNRYVVANIQNGKRCRCAYQNAFEQLARREHVNFGGADGIRTHDLPGGHRDARTNRSIITRSFQDLICRSASPRRAWSILPCEPRATDRDSSTTWNNWRCDMPGALQGLEF